MLKALLHKISIYEKYNKLVTNEGKRIFIRTVYTLSFCTAATIFIWYIGIFNLSSVKHDGLIPKEFLYEAETGLNEQIVLAEKTVSSRNEKKNTGSDPDSRLPSTARAIVTTGPAVTTNEANKTESKSSPPTKSKSKEQPVKKQKVQQTIYKGENRPNVALTFDDGYNKKTIIKVLDVLKSNNVKATFFIIGRVLDDYPEVWKRAIDEGHQICNHTVNHATLTKLSDQQVKNEIIGWESCVKKTLGEEYLLKMKKEFPYLRLPGGGGNKNDRILSIAQSCGYKVIGWNLETNSSIINPLKNTHTALEIAEKIEKHVVNNCSNGSIILLHFNQYDIPNLDKIVTGIKKRGYGLQTVTEVLKKN